MTNELKSVCCFDFNGYNNFFKKAIEFNTNDNLDNCKITPCRYFTVLPETAQTILNTPWGTKPFPFSMDVLKTTDDTNGIIQIISARLALSPPEVPLSIANVAILTARSLEQSTNGGQPTAAHGS